jgi:transglutaminase-like putative cysteine protease
MRRLQALFAMTGRHLQGLPVFLFGVLLILMFSGPPLSADTIVLQGKLESTLRISKEMRWTVDRPISQLTVNLAMPVSFSNKVLSQGVRNLQVEIFPKPARVEDEQDNLGNLRKKITWHDLKADPEVRIVFDARVEAVLSAMESTQVFPLKALPSPERHYLKSTPLVQSDSPEIQALSRELTHHATTEFHAVTAVINYMADNIRYVYNPARYDAVSTLRAGSGNCTNAAHLSAALLRAAGIPARVVAGTTLDKQLKVPMDGGRSLVQTMGKGGHAWIEVYFPDLGWLSYDPKQSKQFTSTRHVKESHGLDSTDIAENWTGTPYAPAYSGTIDARFIEDDVKVQTVFMQNMPRSHMMSNDLKATVLIAQNIPEPASPRPAGETPPGPAPFPAPAGEGPSIVHAPATVPQGPIGPAGPPSALAAPQVPATRPAEAPAPVQSPTPAPAAVQPPAPPPVEPPPPAPVQPPSPAPVQPPAPGPLPPKEVVLGNIEFPSLVATYSVSGDTGSKLLDAETAEYVTSAYVYAQAFTLDEPATVRDISLAMHKFGGDGTLYIDLVGDDGDKPALHGCRSLPVFLDAFEKKPGYSWLTFTFPEGSPERMLPRGKHWIVLRHSGEAVMTWFFTPGKSYSGPEDTRSTSKGHLWEDILAYDFVFRVRGVR